MKHHSILLFGVIFALIVFLSGCTRIIYQPVEYQADTRKYDSAFPYGDMAEQLQSAYESVKRILVTGTYQTYVFNAGDQVTVEDLQENGIQHYSVHQYSSDTNKAGTATVISSSKQNLALITSDHIVTLQDTLYQYAETPDDESEIYLQSVSVKTGQVNLLFDQPELGFFSVIASDPIRDLAILNVNFKNENRQIPDATDNPLGYSEDLELGSFVYVLGFPRGHQMVHNGLVSSPNYDNRGGFITNALFNPGISGSPIFARRSADSKLEIVGIAKGSQGSVNYFLAPDPALQSDFNQNMPYQGPIFVSGLQQINYGITYSVSTNEIRQFLSEHQQVLSEEGFNPSGWIDD